MHYCRPPFPEELELALMIIFAVFLRASEVGCFLGGRWDGIQRWLGGETKKKREKGRRDIWRGGLVFRQGTKAE